MPRLGDDCRYATDLDSTLIHWLNRIVHAFLEIVHAFLEDDETEWEVEPYLTNNVTRLFSIAQREGDPLEEPRVIRNIVTFPTFEMATRFRDNIPLEWKTKVSKRSDGEAWQCECDQQSVPETDKLIASTKRLWYLALNIHPVLWAYTGMYDATGTTLWYVAPPLLEYDVEET